MRASTSILPEEICRALRRSNSASGGEGFRSLDGAAPLGGRGTGGPGRPAAGVADARAGGGVAPERGSANRSTDATRGLALTRSRLRVARSQSSASSAVTVRRPPPDFRPAPLIAGLSPAPLAPPRHAPACLSAAAR